MKRTHDASAEHQDERNHESKAREQSTQYEHSHRSVEDKTHLAMIPANAEM